MKKLIVCLILMLMCSSLYASEQNCCDMNSLEVFTEWYDYCHYVDDLGESYLCEISALDVIIIIYTNTRINCWRARSSYHLKNPCLI